ncbi:MAG: 30S ribosomal protein S17e [Nanoarchaeota archaeon]|nr:30S ribosomal protein S17e [Nanoarchaeota archaeon]
MGRIKGTIIKRSGKDLIRYNPGKFNSNFEDNKKIVIQILPEVNKKFINSIAGYVTRLVKKEETKK